MKLIFLVVIVISIAVTTAKISCSDIGICDKCDKEELTVIAIALFFHSVLILCSSNAD